MRWAMGVFLVALACSACTTTTRSADGSPRGSVQMYGVIDEAIVIKR